MDWQSCEVSKPFHPLLMDMMMDALCSYHSSDLSVGDHGMHAQEHKGSELRDTA